MKIAVISEVSARSKNADIIAALDRSSREPLELFNVGMTEREDKIELTYIHTGFMAGLLLNLNIVDMVIGGCGTGQGFLNSALQYPNVVCGLIQDPLDAFLFSRINGGNCISLALNKGYGWAGELNLRFIFEKLFETVPGQGYPPERQESQRESRRILRGVSLATHRSFEDILVSIDKDIVRRVFSHQPFYELVMRDNKPYIEAMAGDIL